MPPRTVIHTVRAIFLLLCVVLGMSAATTSSGDIPHLTAAILGLIFGGLVIGLDIILRNLTIRSFSAGTFGLMTGIFCAWLITSIPWAQGDDPKTSWIKLGIYLSLGYLGTALSLRSNRQEFSSSFPTSASATRASSSNRSSSIPISSSTAAFPGFAPPDSSAALSLSPASCSMNSISSPTPRIP